jgi:SNF2 family DNA or RNA helicase
MNRKELEQLKSELELALPASVQERGKRLTEQEQVLLLASSGTAEYGWVGGTQKRGYQVEVDFWSQGYLFNPACDCECAYFKSNRFGCKHIYAMVLTLLEQAPEEDAPLQPQSPPKTQKDGRLRFLFDPERSGEINKMCLIPAYKGDDDSLEAMIVAESMKKQWGPQDSIWLKKFLMAHETGIQGMSSPHFILPVFLFLSDLPGLLDAGCLFLKSPEPPTGNHPVKALANRLHEEWRVDITATKIPEGLQLEGELCFEDQKRSLDEAALVLEDGYIFREDAVTRIKEEPDARWALGLIEEGPVQLPHNQIDEFLVYAHLSGAVPTLHLPEEYQYREETRTPTPHLRLSKDPEQGKRLLGLLFFAYGDDLIAAEDERDPVFDTEHNAYYARRDDLESSYRGELIHLGAREHRASVYSETSTWKIPLAELDTLMKALRDRDWEITWNGQNLHIQSDISYQVSSSTIDWFDVEGTMIFDQSRVQLPELLQALNTGDGFVELPDGSRGWIPQDLREQLNLLQRMGDASGKDGKLRFNGAQSLILDFMLSSLPDVDWNEKARGLQQKLRNLSAPKAAKAPEGFQGTLRGYQEEGLGWLRYLQQLGIHGCLADDMGLGKTIQMLALLEERRHENAGPSLVVVPKSLVYNWRQEAQQFTPGLQVVPLWGTRRPKSPEELPPADLYVTTYSLVMRDIKWLKDVSFDYVILDESQTIKNANTKTAKACRLLKGRYRLTMTGTPVENRLDDLWSQLEFLNPGLMGKGKWSSKNLTPDTLEMLGQSLRPFLLRRTKEKVAKELPAKVEETIFCDMAPRQHKLYHDLKVYYQHQLSDKVKSQGLNKSKIIVLEALLRLRQAACHPGLISKEHQELSSGKLLVLQDLLDDILPSGHKVLIFSQFTSMLALVKTHLAKNTLPYAYLDGKSRDRDQQIDRFQSDPACPLFLISLKAGGVGLNLTAADYVILLDPWWNPAVEAQAIDRAHRIGQTKKVFAYRIVSKDTIEDKILQLQDQKRELAEAILTRNNSLLSSLRPEDLEFLLG